jgi:hypothetical protein
MNIFNNFGFQMIVATPLKSVMTLEPFIGGACFVDISDRRVSGVLLIEYDHERQSLNLLPGSGESPGKSPGNPGGSSVSEMYEETDSEAS